MFFFVLLVDLHLWWSEASQSGLNCIGTKSRYLYVDMIKGRVGRVIDYDKGETVKKLSKTTPTKMMLEESFT